MNSRFLKLGEIIEMYDNIEVDGFEYWKELILGTITNFSRGGIAIKITEKQIENAVADLFNDDKLWQEIDMALINAINNNSSGEILNFKKYLDKMNKVCYNIVKVKEERGNVR